MDIYHLLAWKLFGPPLVMEFGMSCQQPTPSSVDNISGRQIIANSMRKKCTKYKEMDSH